MCGKDSLSKRINLTTQKIMTKQMILAAAFAACSAFAQDAPAPDMPGAPDGQPAPEMRGPRATGATVPAARAPVLARGNSRSGRSIPA